MNISQWTCTYILLPLTGIRSLHKTQGEAQTWPQAVSHRSVSSPSTRISLYEAFRNTNCKKTNNCNNCCPRSDLKLQSKTVSQNSHTTAFIFRKKKKKNTSQKTSRSTSTWKQAKYTYPRQHLSLCFKEELMRAFQGKALEQHWYRNKILYLQSGFGLWRFLLSLYFWWRYSVVETHKANCNFKPLHKQEIVDN